MPLPNSNTHSILRPGRTNVSKILLTGLCLAWCFTLPAIAQDGTNFTSHLQTASFLAQAAVDAEANRHKDINEHEAVILEGDSWFDLPRPHTDLADAIEDLGYVVMSVAERGDTLENMAFNGQLMQVATQFRTLANYNKTPIAILLSGGGNDIIGPNLQFILNHRESTIGARYSNDEQSESRWQESILRGALDRYRSYIFDYVAGVSLLCMKIAERGELSLLELDCKRIPIVIHGYDYPMSSGIGFKYLWLFRLKGPWLKPSFDAKAYNDNSANHILIELVNRFNSTLSSAVTSIRVSKKLPNPICYLDLRGTVSKDQWNDELHPNREAMQIIAIKFVKKFKNCK